MMTDRDSAPRKRILVVDDDPDVLESLVDELSKSYDVTPVNGADAALASLESQPFDALISDVRMPGTSGVDLMRSTRRLGHDLVRIILTGFADDDAAAEARQPGGAYKLGKPWGDELQITLQHALEQRDAMLAASRQMRVTREQNDVALRRLDKLASLGTATAGVAHELRVPLAYLAANVQWLNDVVAGLPQGADATVKADMLDELRSVAADCQVGTNRLAEVIEYLRLYATPTRSQLTSIDLRACIHQAVQLISFRYKSTVPINIMLPPNPVTVLGHQGELSQILINLLLNAAQAMGESGEIDIRCPSPAGNSVSVEVSDHGPGVPDSLQDRLFESFFTTKTEANGNGLGLSISRDIARRHGGDLVYKKAAGPGATFVLTLPLPTEAQHDGSRQSK